MKKTNNSLKSWLFNKPILFVLLSCICTIIFSLIASVIDSVFTISDTTYQTMVTIFALAAFIYPIYYMIKKLPDEKMYRNDFIAIVNGANIISLVASFIVILTLGLYTGSDIKRDLMFMYVLQPTLFTILALIAGLSTVYLIGVAISGIYAKYKRCRQMGIDKWKIILSMPFAFLMLWTPGYLIDDKNKKSVLEIKSKWYSKFNKWVVSNFSNTLFVFLFLLFCKNIISGLPTILLAFALLVLYTLWYVKHKKDFVKNINNGYALTAIGINIAIIMAVLFF